MKHIYFWFLYSYKRKVFLDRYGTANQHSRALEILWAKKGFKTKISTTLIKRGLCNYKLNVKIILYLDTGDFEKMISAFNNKDEACAYVFKNISKSKHKKLLYYNVDWDD